MKSKVDCGYDVSEDRKDRLNKELAVKEIRTLDQAVLFWCASVLKKEKEEATGNGEAQTN